MPVRAPVAASALISTRMDDLTSAWADTRRSRPGPARAVHAPAAHIPARQTPALLPSGVLAGRGESAAAGRAPAGPGTHWRTRTRNADDTRAAAALHAAARSRPRKVPA